MPLIDAEPHAPAVTRSSSNVADSSINAPVRVKLTAIRGSGPFCRIDPGVRAFLQLTNQEWSMAMAEHSEATSTLNTLIATTIDSVTGYEDSA